MVMKFVAGCIQGCSGSERPGAKQKRSTHQHLQQRRRETENAVAAPCILLADVSAKRRLKLQLFSSSQSVIETGGVIP